MKYILPVLPLKRSLQISCVVVVIVVIVVGMWWVTPVQAATGINKTINFQGKLVDNNGLNVADNTYSVVFTLYDASSGGANLWDETQSVSTNDGLFQVALGSVDTSLGNVDFNSDNLYLGIKVGADAEMTPRIRFSAVPYAFNAQKVAGLTVTDTTGTLTIPNGKTIQFSDAFSTTGAFSLNLTTTGTTSLSLPTTGTLLTNAADSNQTITSTQTSGTVLGITDTTNSTGATTGLSVTMSGTGAFDQTGLSFNLSGATGTNTNDIVGSGGSWKVSRDGDLTVASCTGCGGGNNYGDELMATYAISEDAGNNLTINFNGAVDAAPASSSGTITLPSNTSKMIVEMKAAGGGGGGTNTATAIKNAGGGGEGGYSREFINTIATNYYVKVGGGGAGGTAGATGAQGTASCFGTNAADACNSPLLSATGGSGGVGINAVGVAAGGAGGTASGGNVNIVGQPGFNSSSVANASWGGAGGGISGARSVTVAGNGTDGSNGGGGSGAGGITSSATARSGGRGGDGYMVIHIYKNASTGASGGDTWNQYANGVLAPVNLTSDILFGSNATSSAKFGFLNMSEGTPTASLSAGVVGGAYLTASGLLQTTANQTLTLGGTTTGNILINPQGNNFVGIGTNSPLAPLDVRTSLGTGPTASISATSPFAALVVNNRTGDLFTASASGLNRFVIKNNGFVGINTSNPQTLLDMKGTEGQDAILTLDADDGDDTTDTWFIESEAADNDLSFVNNTTELMKLTSAGTLHLAAVGYANCSMLTTVSNIVTCGSAPSSSTQYVRLNQGAFSFVNDTADFLFGSAASTSAKFKLSATGTQPTASVSGITSMAALVVNQDGNGDIIAASKSGFTHFVVNNAGNVGIGKSAPTSKLDVAGMITNTGSLESLAMTVGNDADPDTMSALSIGVTSASTGDTDDVYGINIENLAGAGSTVNEAAIHIGSGWDSSIEFADGTPNIQFTTTDNTSDFTITDASSNALLRMRDMSTNFGAALYAGAFINFNSMVAEEFNRTRTSLSADTTGAQNGAFGNGGGWGVYEGGTTPNCTFSTLADTVNGITRVAANAAATGCMTMIDDAINNAKLMYNVANLPVIVMKLRPSQADASSGIYAGLADSTDGAVAAPTNFIGFSNDNAGTLGNTWRGITRSAGTSTTLTCTGQTISTTQFALLVIEVRSSTSVRFFIDNDVSNGVTLTECGAGSTTNIYTSNLAPQIHWQERAGGTASNLDLDFYRTWQDDAPMVDGLTSNEPEALSFADDTSASQSLDTHDVVMGTMAQDEFTEEVTMEDSGDLLAGLDPLQSKVADLADKVASIEAKLSHPTASPSSASQSLEVSSSSAEKADVSKIDNLSVSGLATVSANFRVQGNGLIEGILNVVDTLTVSNFIVNKLATFFAEVVFHSDVLFKGTPYFNSDTAGYVTITKGQDKVDVKFAKPYKDKPVVNASVVTTELSDESFDQMVKDGICGKEKAICEEKSTQKALAASMPYVISARSTEGFTILLSQPATQDLTFSWSALAVLRAEEISLKGGDQ